MRKLLIGTCATGVCAATVGGYMAGIAPRDLALIVAIAGLATFVALNWPGSK